MDLSGLIFVALAVAWAAYLIPKALSSSDDASRSRTVERFSHTVRVLARREPVDARKARLVVTPGRPAAAAVPVVPAAESDPDAQPVLEVAAVAELGPEVALPLVSPRARREVARKAARRRRRVLLLLVVATAAVAGLAAGGLLAWAWVAVPVAWLAAWLVACRLMVRRERAAEPASPPLTKDAAAAPTEPPVADGPVTEEIAAQPVTDAAPTAVSGADPVAARPSNSWDPVPTTLPTYVAKEPAARTVRTIDLDATGVWTSGRTEADARLAREAELAEQAQRAGRARGAPPSSDRATGS